MVGLPQLLHAHVLANVHVAVEAAARELGRLREGVHDILTERRETESSKMSTALTFELIRHSFKGAQQHYLAVSLLTRVQVWNSVDSITSLMLLKFLFFF